MMRTPVNTTPRPYLLIRPASGWQPVNFRELWQFRDLLYSLAIRDIKLRYRQTAMGVIWVVLQPLLGALIFAFVFNKVAGLKSGETPYLLFTYAGLIAWTAFSGTLARAQMSLVGNAQMISKIYFPRLTLPFSTAIGTLLDFGVALVMMFIFMACYRIMPHVGLLLLPVWLALIYLLAMGFGLITAALMVSYRDVNAIMTPLTTFWMYISPVAYAVSVVPERFRPLYFLNPMASLLEAFRWSLFGNGSLQPLFLLYSAVFSIVIFFVGTLVFRRMERKFADVI